MNNLRLPIEFLQKSAFISTGLQDRNFYGSIIVL